MRRPESASLRSRANRTSDASSHPVPRQSHRQPTDTTHQRRQIRSTNVELRRESTSDDSLSLREKSASSLGLRTRTTLLRSWVGPILGPIALPDTSGCAAVPVPRVCTSTYAVSSATHTKQPVRQARFSLSNH